jgi:hypothetical protein
VSIIDRSVEDNVAHVPHTTLIHKWIGNKCCRGRGGEERDKRHEEDRGRERKGVRWKLTLESNSFGKSSVVLLSGLEDILDGVGRVLEETQHRPRNFLRSQDRAVERAITTVAYLEDTEPTDEGVGRELEMFVEVAVDELSSITTTTVDLGVTARWSGECWWLDVRLEIGH